MANPAMFVSGVRSSWVIIEANSFFISDTRRSAFKASSWRRRDAATAVVDAVKHTATRRGRLQR